ncbi:MAG: hypothetical protein WC351_04780 [Candidatus Izemoplasmatales bacterium]|jgi:hypothetical protein
MFCYYAQIEQPCAIIDLWRELNLQLFMCESVRLLEYVSVFFIILMTMEVRMISDGFDIFVLDGTQKRRFSLLWMREWALMTLMGWFILHHCAVMWAIAAIFTPFSLGLDVCLRIALLLMIEVFAFGFIQGIISLIGRSLLLVLPTMGVFWLSETHVLEPVLEGEMINRLWSYIPNIYWWDGQWRMHLGIVVYICIVCVLFIVKLSLAMLREYRS